jgi:lipopolysaccharide export system protein LptA
MLASFSEQAGLILAVSVGMLAKSALAHQGTGSTPWEIFGEQQETKSGNEKKSAIEVGNITENEEIAPACAA